MLLLRQPDPHHSKADGDHAATDPEQYPVFVSRARLAHRFHHIARSPRLHGPVVGPVGCAQNW